MPTTPRSGQQILRTGFLSPWNILEREDGQVRKMGEFPKSTSGPFSHKKTGTQAGKPATQYQLPILWNERCGGGCTTWRASERRSLGVHALAGMISKTHHKKMARVAREKLWTRSARMASLIGSSIGDTSAFLPPFPSIRQLFRVLRSMSFGRRRPTAITFSDQGLPASSSYTDCPELRLPLMNLKELNDDRAWVDESPPLNLFRRFSSSI